jgi:hypothetical protein
MGWINRLLRRGDSDAEWVAKNPGKRDFQVPATTEEDLAEQRRIRAQMEAEMKTDGARMTEQNAREEATPHS